MRSMLLSCFDLCVVVLVFRVEVQVLRFDRLVLFRSPVDRLLLLGRWFPVWVLVRLIVKMVVVPVVVFASLNV